MRPTLPKTTMRLNWEFETCRCCSREQRLAWSVDDVLWDKVVIDYYKRGVLCLECFLRIADDGHIQVKIGDIKFTGLVAQK